MTSHENEYFASVVVAFIGGSIELLGLIGNAALWIALMQPGRQKPMYIILRSMCLTDLAIVLFSFLFQALPAAGNLTSRIFSWVMIAYRVSYYIWPIASATHFMKVWLTVLLSVERWTAVCRPLKFRMTGSASRVRLQILIVGFAALVFVLPRFFEYECTYTYSSENTDKINHPHSNSSNSSSSLNASATWSPDNVLTTASIPSDNDFLCEWLPTKLAQSVVFSVCYGVIAYALLMFVFPVGVVLLLNSLIIAELSQPDSLVAELTVMQKYERKISKIPLCVAIVFCILQTPALIINVIHFSGLAKAYPYWSVTLAIGGTLISANSAVDFLVCFYNIGGLKQMRVRNSRRPLRVSESVAPERSPRFRTNNDVHCDESTKKRWILINSLSAEQLTIHHSETVTSKSFRTAPLTVI